MYFIREQACDGNGRIGHPGAVPVLHTRRHVAAALPQGAHVLKPTVRRQLATSLAGNFHLSADAVSLREKNQEKIVNLSLPIGC